MYLQIFMPNFMQPFNQSIDMSLPQIFSCQINGNQIDSYQLIIKKLDNTVVYDSSKVSLATILYNGQTLSITVPQNSVTFRGQLKWTLTYWNNTESVSSGEMIFTNLTTPTLVTTMPTSITSKMYNLTYTYSQAENIPIKRWNIELFDSNDNSLESSGDVYSSLIQYQLDGLVNNTNYYVVITVETQSQSGLGMLVSTINNFTVQYPALILNFKPTLTQIDDKSAVQIDWSLLSQNPGIITGNSNYIDKYLRDNNVGFSLDKGSILEYDSFTLPPNFTMSFMQQIPKDFNGVFFTTKDGNYKLGYNNIPSALDSSLTYTGTWTSEIASGYHNGVAKYSTIANNNITYTFNGTGINVNFIQSEHMGQVEIFVDSVSQGIVDLYKDALDNSCPTTQISDGLYTKQYITSKAWTDISASTWNSLSAIKWSDMIYKHIYFSVSNLPHGSHTVKINLLGTKNVLSDSTKVEFEYLQLLNSDTDNQFYSIIQGVTQNSETIRITDNPFVFILFPDHVIIKQYNIYNTWSNIANYTWNDLSDFTWEFMAQLNN